MSAVVRRTIIMGMDLIGVGFTHDTNVKCSQTSIQAFIDKIPADLWLNDSFLTLMANDGQDDWDEFEPGAAAGLAVRARVEAAAAEYIDAVAGHRCTVSYDLGDTPLVFVFAGGSSWGESPFGGFDELCFFLNWLGVGMSYVGGPFQDVTHDIGFVCGGIPELPL